MKQLLFCLVITFYSCQTKTQPEPADKRIDTVISKNTSHTYTYKFYTGGGELPAIRVYGYPQGEQKNGIDILSTVRDETRETVSEVSFEWPNSVSETAAGIISLGGKFVRAQIFEDGNLIADSTSKESVTAYYKNVKSK
jgi:hypothetical protein